MTMVLLIIEILTVIIVNVYILLSFPLNDNFYFCSWNYCYSYYYSNDIKILALVF
jgi:hypothetical protein